MDTNTTHVNHTITIDSTELHIGIANVVLALSDCGVLDINQFLLNLEKRNERPGWATVAGDRLQTPSGKSIARLLRQVVPTPAEPT